MLLRLAQPDAEHTNLLIATPDEAALAIVCFLFTAREGLQLACRRFSVKSFRPAAGVED